VTEPLRRLWDDQAPAWAAWARAADHDAFWHFTRWRLLEIVPDPGSVTLDLGCGEGRLARALTARGHHVVGVDGSPTLVGLAATHDEPTLGSVADLAALPIRDEVADVAVACMSLHDVDDLDGAVREAARVLAPGGRLSVAIVHPLNSAGGFTDREAADAPFVIEGAYLSQYRYSDDAERDGHTFTFHSMHRPLEAYARAFEDAGMLIETIREPRWDGSRGRTRANGWHRIPVFCFLRAVKPSEPRPADRLSA
jgi:SAM-dependent methyltransferase